MTFTNLCAFNCPNTSFNSQSWTQTAGRGDASEAEHKTKCALNFSRVQLLECHNQNKIDRTDVKRKRNEERGEEEERGEIGKKGGT